MNVKLLEATKKRILRAPKRLNMHYYGTSCKGINLDHILIKPVCNTQSCIAGEGLLAAKLARINRKDGGIVRVSDGCQPDFEREAQEAFDIDVTQGLRLFHLQWTESTPFHWPLQFDREYKAATTPEERAQVTARRIDHFIATNGAE